MSLSWPQFRRVVLSAVLMGAPLSSQAFSILGRSWASGDILMQLQLGSPATALTDGSTNWDMVAESALNDWNTHLARSQFQIVRSSTAAKSSNNRLNNVFFSPTVYGEAWGSNVLAVTLRRSSSTRSIEGDVLFNSNRSWDSYRGALRRQSGAAMDFRRVALHEFGHVLGLDHPDDATPVQNVTAVMNSTVSSIETLQADDLAGAAALYDGSVSAPSIAAQPADGAVQVTGSYTLNVAAAGSGPLTYTWTFRATGAITSEPFRLATGPSYTIGSVQPADAGTYSVTINNPLGTVTSRSAALAVTPIASSSDTLLANISTRGSVGTGDRVLIAGIVIRGEGPKNIIIRAIGPSLARYNIQATLADPQLTLFNAAGQVMAQNDNWGTAANAGQLPGVFNRLGAFELEPGSRDAALLVSLPPGNYTAQVSGVGNTTGIALVEAYDADAEPAKTNPRKLVNISTRGFVGTGENVLIAGLVVAGPGPRTYLIRAVGPTLATSSFNLTGVLNDPLLQIYQGENLLRENDDWNSPASAQAALREAATQVGAFPLQVTRDSAMLVTLQPGNYTAKVSGFTGGTGIALVEIYELP